jgi:hypothetical protein
MLCSRDAVGGGEYQFTCFTSTKVQILSQNLQVQSTNTDAEKALLELQCAQDAVGAGEYHEPFA